MTHQAGVSVSAQSAPSGYTALHLACLSGHVGVVGLLLSRSTGGPEILEHEVYTGCRGAADLGLLT